MKPRLTFRQIKSSSDQLRAVYMQRSGHVRTWKGVFWLPIAVHALKHVLPFKTDVGAAWTAVSCSPFSTRRGFSSYAWMRCQSAQLGPLIRLPGHTPARTWVQICLSWRDGLFAVWGRRHCSTTEPHFWHFANMCVAADCWCSAAILWRISSVRPVLPLFASLCAVHQHSSSISRFQHSVELL